MKEIYGIIKDGFLMDVIFKNICKAKRTKAKMDLTEGLSFCIEKMSVKEYLGRVSIHSFFCSDDVNNILLKLSTYSHKEYWLDKIARARCAFLSQEYANYLRYSLFLAHRPSEVMDFKAFLTSEKSKVKKDLKLIIKNREGDK